MKRASSAIVISALAAACGPPLQEPGTARIVELAADPLPRGTYQGALVQAPAVARCAAAYAASYNADYPQRAEEEASTCLWKSGDESALPGLLVLGVTNERKPGDEITLFEDAVKASAHAGQIAAATSPRELLAMLLDPNPSTEAFALAALTTMLKTQESAGAPVGVAAKIAAACVPLLDSPDARVAITAAACVGAAGQDSAGPVLGQVYLTNPSMDVKAAAVTALAELRGAALDDATLHGIGDFLHTPIPKKWFISDVRAREMACVVLAQHARGAAWSIEAALAASEAMKIRGGSNGQNYPPSCAALSKVK